MNETVYIKMHPHIQVSPNQIITLGDISEIFIDHHIKAQAKKIPIHHIQPKDQNIIVIDIMAVIHEMKERYPFMEIQTIGPAQTVIEVVYPKKKINIISFIAVWLLLFVGSGLAVMNFHEDVSMREVHQNIFYIITGYYNSKPLLLQIPYSIGLGLGMVLFFNHLFRKRLNEEPSPLEVEMFKYQQDLDSYSVTKANKERMGKKHEH